MFKSQIEKGHGWALIPWKDMSAILDKVGKKIGDEVEEDLDAMRAGNPFQPASKPPPESALQMQEEGTSDEQAENEQQQMHQEASL